MAHSVFSVCDGFLDRILCVAGAVVFSQAPEFMQQYLQRLGGHVDEARRQVTQYRTVAEQSNLTLDQFIAQTSKNSDAAVAKLGGVMHEATARLQELQDAQNALLHAPVFTRPIVFAQHFDKEIAHATWSIFKPAVPATIEGVVYAFVGLFLILAIYHLVIRVPVRTAYHRARRRNPKLYADV
ncbi:MAG TPA: DUF2937 family protein [Opitutaceae bacterium]|nr:DUF2937 family protein [Opitutaceae bacterium]